MNGLVWDCHDLETVGCCPVCGGSGELLYSEVKDYFYKTGGEGWRLFRCTSCRSVYLNPRPTPDTIHKAYSSYATHQRAERLPPEKLHGLRWVQRVLANGYKNAVFGTNYRPSSALGRLAAKFLPAKRALMDREFRHLPKGSGRVLDIGFGDGSFLLKAQDMGWSAVGIDVDPCVVEEARNVGLDAYLGHPSDLPKSVGQFDAITMNHVIEHVHQPTDVLAQCYELLKPGGMLWIETPNIDSSGHKYFRKFWRGLEVPRHLVIFNVDSLREALANAGFVGISHLPQTLIDLWPLSESARRSHSTDGAVPAGLGISRLSAAVLSRFSDKNKEFIAVAAFKGPA